MDEWKKLHQAVDRLKVDLIRVGVAPIYRAIRWRKTAAAWDERADQIEQRLNDGVEEGR